MRSRRRARRPGAAGPLGTVGATCLLVAIAATASPVRGLDAASPFAAPFVVLGMGGGAMHVDLPDPDRPGTSFGTQPRVTFALGLEARPWLEIGAELGYTYLPESDSLNARLDAQGSQERALRTHLQALVDLRARWLRGTSGWAPFVRGGAGVAAFYTHAGDLVRESDSDPAWDAGGGIDWYPQRHILVRIEGAYVGQSTGDGTRAHTVASLAVHYALHRGQVGLGETAAGAGGVSPP